MFLVLPTKEGEEEFIMLEQRLASLDWEVRRVGGEVHLSQGRSGGGGEGLTSLD